jgi:MFS family permease
VVGLSLLSPGLAVLVYGLSAVARQGGHAQAEAVLGIGLGVAMLAMFVAHALRAEQPLLELRHFANQTFSAAAAIQLLMGVVLIGAMFLLPLYFQVARGESAWRTGLLLVPQGVGAALSLWLTGRLVDAGRGKAVVLTGIPLLAVGFVAYTQAASEPRAVVLLASLLAMGLGIGCLMAPVNAAAYSVLDRAAIPRATSTLNITQRVGGAVGTAVFAVVLEHQLGQAQAGSGAASVTATAEAFGATFWWPLALAALMLAPALLLPSARKRPAGTPTSVTSAEEPTP